MRTVNCHVGLLLSPLPQQFQQGKASSVQFKQHVLPTGDGHRGLGPRKNLGVLPDELQWKSATI